MAERFPRQQASDKDLSPLLFLFYINNLANILPANNVNALFADDVSVLATNHSKEQAETDAQKSVDVVVRWAKRS